MLNKQQYQDKIQAQVDKIGDAIRKLQNEADMARITAKAEYHQELAELREKRALLEAELDHLRVATGDAWEDIKLGVDSAWLDVKKSLQQAQDRFL